MRHIKTLYVLPLVALALVATGALHAYAQELEDLPDVSRTILIENATITTAPGEVMENASLLVQDGIIQEVAEDITAPYDAQQVDGTEMYVYAGFVDGMSHAGAGQEDAYDEEVDHPDRVSFDRAGIHPQRAVHDQLDADDNRFDALRSSGFTTVHVVPRGRMLPGSGAVYQLNDWSADRMLLDDDSSVFFQFSGASGVFPATDMGVIATMRQLVRETERRQQVAEAFEQERRGQERPEYDRVHEALTPVATREQMLMTRTDNALDIFRALSLAEELDIQLALVGLEQAFEATDELADADVPLFFGLDLPDAPDTGNDTLFVDPATGDTIAVDDDPFAVVSPGPDEDYFMMRHRTLTFEDIEQEHGLLEARRALAYQAYLATPSVMREAGLTFGVTTHDVAPDQALDNLRLMVGNGFDEDDALAALTVNGAQHLNLDEQLGTLEAGKIGNAVVTDAPLFSEEANIRYVLVDGRKFEYDVPDPDEENAEPDEDAAEVLAGEWRTTINTPEGDVSATMSVTGSPGSWSATIRSGDFPEPIDASSVTLDGSSFQMSFSVPGQGLVEVNARIEGTTMSGTVTVPGFGGLPFSAERTDTP